jgi:hypothetical protein
MRHWRIGRSVTTLDHSVEGLDIGNDVDQWLGEPRRRRRRRSTLEHNAHQCVVATLTSGTCQGVLVCGVAIGGHEIGPILIELGLSLCIENAVDDVPRQRIALGGEHMASANLRVSDPASLARELMVANVSVGIDMRKPALAHLREVSKCERGGIPNQHRLGPGFGLGQCLTTALIQKQREQQSQLIVANVAP